MLPIHVTCKAQSQHEVLQLLVDAFKEALGKTNGRQWSPLWLTMLARTAKALHFLFDESSSELSNILSPTFRQCQELGYLHEWQCHWLASFFDGISSGNVRRKGAA